MLHVSKNFGKDITTDHVELNQDSNRVSLNHNTQSLIYNAIKAITRMLGLCVEICDNI